jgi:hypothetical protein
VEVADARFDKARFRLRRSVLFGLILVAGFVAYLVVAFRFPSDRTPEGAYLRVAKAVNLDRPEEFFAYLEEPAQHAAYSILTYRKQSLSLAEREYPKEARASLEKRYGALAKMGDGSDVFAWIAREEGWLEQLRRDVSGIRSCRVDGDRATVETVRGTRYSFRRRPNGIWGMTAFTPFLVEEAEQAARDHGLVEKAADDYARVRARTPPNKAP